MRLSAINCPPELRFVRLRQQLLSFLDAATRVELVKVWGLFLLNSFFLSAMAKQELRRFFFAFFALYISCITAALPALAEQESTEVVPKVGASIDWGLQFFDQDGRQLGLNSLFADGRPVILIPASYRCTRLCTFTLSGVAKLIRELPLEFGKDYNVLAVSFDSSDGPALARERFEKYMSDLTVVQQDQAGWYFLTGSANNIAPLMRQIGFRFHREDADWAHDAVIVVLTPQGKIFRYFNGYDFPAVDVRRALVEAADGSIGSIADHLYLYCFHFDHTTGQYVPDSADITVIINFCVGALIVLFIAVWYLRKKKPRVPAG